MMLGCQDFCGYYDWSFHHVRSRFGSEGLQRFWAEAIGVDSQVHYAQAAEKSGLRGLLEAWSKTGGEEHCDWELTLDEARNILRWDMRACPSKGFLLEHDLNACEDYCDHCMGWIIPLLQRVGAVVVAHEHNHCGQCWAEISMKGREHEPLDLAGDVRRSPEWHRGCIDRWRDGRKLPLIKEIAASADPCDVLEAWFARTDRILVLGRGPSAMEPRAHEHPGDAVVVTEATYATCDVFDGDPLGVLIGDKPAWLDEVTRRFLGTAPERRPLLMHMYLPGAEQVDFGSFGLPRPVPILPLLIREGFYTHRPGQPYPTTGVFLVMLSVALGKVTRVLGIDNYRHPSGKVYGAEPIETRNFTLPPRHKHECDLEHLRGVVRKAHAPVQFPLHLRELLAEQPETGLSFSD